MHTVYRGYSAASNTNPPAKPRRTSTRAGPIAAVNNPTTNMVLRGRKKKPFGVYVCMYVCMHVCMSMRVCVCVYVRMHVCQRGVDLFICMCVYMENYR